MEPLATVIQHLLAQSDLATLVGTRIASRHRYAQDSGGWQLTDQGIAVGALPGSVPRVDDASALRLEVRCYAQGTPKAFAVATMIERVCERTQRTPVAVGDGTALLYYLVRAGSIAVGYDETINLEYAALTLQAAVALEAIN